MSIEIIFPSSISNLRLDSNQSKVWWTSQDVQWLCIDHLKKSELLIGFFYEEENLTEFLQASSLAKVENESIWLPPSHVFEKNKNQVYKFKVRHRPPSSKIYIENKLLSEYLLLQAIDDFLKGPLGETLTKEVPRKNIITLIEYALLLLPSSLPLKNYDVIDKKHKVKNFDLYNYHKHFSDALYNTIIFSKNKLTRVVDHTFYHSGICSQLDKLKSYKLTVMYYKREFLERLVESHPSYLFESFSSVIDSNPHDNVNVTLVLYNESAVVEEKAGIYINESIQCSLEDIEKINMIKPVPGFTKQWKIELDCNGPKMQNIVLMFDEEEMAVSLMTMLQGYARLCIRPDVNLCPQFTSPSDIIRKNLRSFCPLAHSKAVEYLQNVNDKKAEAEQFNFLIYESKTVQHRFHVATLTNKMAPVCDIQGLDGKRFQVFSRVTSDLEEVKKDPEEFESHDDLRIYLRGLFKQQLRPAKVSQSTDDQSMFYIKKQSSNYETPVEMSEIQRPSYILEEDIGDTTYRIENSEDDDHLNRLIVNVGEDRKMVVELVQRKKVYMTALYSSMSKVAKLYRLQPSSVLGFYGCVFAPTTRTSYVLEHSAYGDLVQFIKREKKLSTFERMKLAREVVNIFCTLSQTESTPGSSLLHGNLRGHNFWVFRGHNRFYLKLGDPGLVPYYDTLPLYKPNNEKRLPWLSPERRNDLKTITVASECYAVGTTIAEIFHSTDDFISVLPEKDRKNKKLLDIFSTPDFMIPEPNFARSEDLAVVQDVINVTKKLWNQLATCWNTHPDKRPLPSELKDAILELEEEARSIAEDTIFEHIKGMLAEMHKDAKVVMRRRIKDISSMAECNSFLKEYQQFFIQENQVESTAVQLGKGAFGVVLKGKLKLQDGQKKTVAIKKSLHSEQHEYDQEFIKEFELCASLDHPNIVRALHHTFEQPGMKPCMVMEYMNAGSLKHFAKDNAKRMTEASYIDLLLKLSLDIARGMEYIGTRKVVHCDLAARNVLLHKDEVSGNITAKVSDFGLAKIVKKNKDYYYVGEIRSTRENLPAERIYKAIPIQWYAPEYLIFERDDGKNSSGINYTTEGDIWAYGTTLWELFTRGRNPFMVLREQGVIGEIQLDYLLDFFEKKRWPQESNVDNDIYGVMMSCWKEDPNQRLRFAEIQSMIENIQCERNFLKT